MRFDEFHHGINIVVNNAEAKLIDSIKDSDEENLNSSNLSESDVELARQMVSRGLLNRKKIDGSTYYFLNI